MWTLLIIALPKWNMHPLTYMSSKILIKDSHMLIPKSLMKNSADNQSPLLDNAPFNILNIVSYDIRKKAVTCRFIFGNCWADLFVLVEIITIKVCIIFIKVASFEGVGTSEKCACSSFDAFQISYLSNNCIWNKWMFRQGLIWSVISSDHPSDSMV